MPISPIQNNLPIAANVGIAQSEEVDFKQGIDAWANEYAPDEHRAIAAQRIMGAYLYKTISLNLDRLKLSTLPVQLGKLEHLYEINLNNNQLTDISVLSSLVNLSSLELDHNRITDIAAVSKLTKLQTLSLVHNTLTRICSLSSLTNLIALRLGENQLTDITALSKLPKLSSLHLFHNQIIDITPLSNLTHLTFLSLSNNQISDIASLSGLTNLTTLGLQDNQLTNVAALSNLTKLSNLFLANNQLTDVVALSNLAELLRLFLNRNQLTSIPECFLRLSSECNLYFGDNRFSEAVIEQLYVTVNTANYTGPRIHFSMSRASDQALKVLPLAEVVASWYQGSTSNISIDFSRAAWEVIDKEPSAKSFSIFLQRLHNTVNSTQPVFKAKVLDWLKRLEDDQELRHEIFLEAKEGLDHCEDRVSLTFNAMKQRELTLNVVRKHYDNKLGELIALARQAFRFNELEKIAYDKVKRLKFVDEVEVYLAYLVKTHKELSLDLDTPEMRFFGVAHVTKGDIQTAILRVKQNENTQFLNYLVNEWAPWPAVLKRLSPEAYKKLDATIYTAQEKAFEERQAVFSANTLVTDVSHFQITREESDEIATSCKREFTQAFLQEKGLGTLLNPVWCVDV